MDASFIPIEVVPTKTPFGLDQLRRSYKTALSATAALAAAPVTGTADETFPNMFLMPITMPESAQSATRIDLVYQGCFGGAAGSPVLPASQETDDEAVMSASNSKSGTTGITAASPMTVQFYAPTRTLSYITYNAKGSKDDVSDPDGSPTVITLTISDSSFTSTSFQVSAIIAAFFSTQITATLKSQELVPGGKYWLNQAQKTTHFVPFISDISPGFYPYPFSGGTGYTVGDTISITSGGPCTMTVQAVYTPGDQIMSVTIASNSLSVASSTAITASGGSGSGASYTVIHIT